MNPTVKSSLIIVITLLIGIAIGFELSEISVKHYMEQMRGPRRPEGFLEMFEKVIKPDEKQKPVIDSILIRYHNKMDGIARSNMSRIRGVVDSMQTELKANLTKEQTERLDNEMAKMRHNAPPPEAPPEDRRGFPPPPPLNQNR